MKICILIFFLICSFNFYGQTIIQGDSLYKYSYTVGAFSGSPDMEFGTCFFIRKDTSLFLITAKHVVYDCDSLKNQMHLRAKFLVLFLTQFSQFIQIPIQTSQRDHCLPAGKDTDLIVIPVSSYWMPFVNTVNEFLLKPFDSVSNLEIFGQGMISSNSSLRFGQLNHFHLNNEDFKVYTSSPNLSDIDDSTYIDNLHYFFSLQTKSIGAEMRGYSGSPVFIQDFKTKRWRLAGVLIIVIPKVSEENRGGFMATKAQYILQRIGLNMTD